MTYRVYVTDAFKHVGHLGGQRYIDRVHDLFKPVETRTGEEIIEHMKNGINNLGKEVEE